MVGFVQERGVSGMGCIGQKWDSLGKSGVFRDSVGCFGKQWDVLGNNDMFWAKTGCFGK